MLDIRIVDKLIHLYLVVEVTDVTYDRLVFHLCHMLDRDDIAVSGGRNEDVTLFHGLFHGRNLETFHSGLQGADRIDLGHEYTGPVRAHGVRAAFTYVTISGNDYHLAGDHYVRSPLDAVRQRLTATV